MHAEQPIQWLRAALDPTFMTRMLQAQLSVPLTRCHIRQVWPRWDGTFSIAYRLSSETDRAWTGRLFTGQLCMDGTAQEKYERARHQGEPVVYLPSLRMILWPFPADRRLPYLDLAGNARAMADIFRWTLRDRFSKVQRCQAALVAYKPGRRAVFRYTLELGSGQQHILYGKVYGDDRGVRTFAHLRHLWAGPFGSKSPDGITIPCPLAYLPEFRMLLQEAVGGHSLFALLGDGRLADYAQQVAQALAKLHRLDLPAAAVHTSQDELNVLLRWINAATTFFPEHHGAFQSVYDVLKRYEDETEPAPLSAGHRDFYDKQVYLAQSRVALLDFDAFAQAEPALDVGNFLAHLTLRAHQALTSSDLVQVAQQTFLRAYEATKGPVDPGRLTFYQTASLLRLACVYALRPGWVSVVQPLFQASEKAVQALLT